MLGPYDTLNTIQRATDEVVRYAAIDVGKIGGADAIDAYLSKSLCNLLAIAIEEQGVVAACQLMAAALITAEQYVEKPRC